MLQRQKNGGQTMGQRHRTDTFTKLQWLGLKEGGTELNNRFNLQNRDRTDHMVQ